VGVVTVADEDGEGSLVDIDDADDERERPEDVGDGEGNVGLNVGGSVPGVVPVGDAMVRERRENRWWR